MKRSQPNKKLVRKLEWEAVPVKKVWVDFLKSVDLTEKISDKEDGGGDSYSLLELPSPSNEQAAAVSAVIFESKIFKLNFVAGFGKTTTSLHLVAANKLQPVLLLTYNARLKQETRTKAETYGLNYLKVHSYHAMGFRYSPSSNGSPLTCLHLQFKVQLQ